ncbi:MAG: alpha/beta hydrolase [Myxococcota bacterium]|nr:alpha/beta hydrolase [Myxococcota bacterium]
MTAFDTIEHRFVANDLAHHVVEWRPRQTHATMVPGVRSQPQTVLLAHGFLDLAWSWRPLAERLASRGFRCVAWDWRGHGETDHVGAGGYYHFPDYVLDLEELFPQLVSDPDERVHLVGHSMGGTVATMFAGLRASKLRTLTLVEGIGPPPYPLERTPEKFEAWLDGMAKLRSKDERAMPSLDAVLDRMRVQSRKLDDALGRFLAEKSTRALDDGSYAWRFDRRHRTTAPMPFRTEIFAAFLERITVPTLYVAGEKGFRLPDEDARLALVKAPWTKHVIGGAGHMLHREEPDALAEAWLAFTRG